MIPARVDLAIMALEKPTIRQDRRAAIEALEALRQSVSTGYVLVIRDAERRIDDYANMVRMGVKPDSPQGCMERAKVLAVIRSLDGAQ